MGDANEIGAVLQEAQRIAMAQVGKWRALSPQDLDDAAGYAAMRYHEKFGDGPGPESLEAWLKTAIANRCKDMVDAAAKRHEVAQAPVRNADHADESHPFLDAVAQTRSTSDTAIFETLMSKIYALVDDETAYVIRERYEYNRRAADVADELGISEAAVNQRAARAKKAFDEALAVEPELREALRMPHPNVYRNG